MLNSYADVTAFKSPEYANIVTNTEQIRFRKLLESASRHLDQATHRQFWCWEGTRYFDGKYGNLLVDDFLSIGVDGILLDEDGDGVYEITMATTDYIIYPLNSYPKEKLEISFDSDYTAFADGIPKGVQITGVWGYGDGVSATPYYLSGQAVVDNPLTAVATTLTVASTATLGAGMTLRIETEQLYIESVSAATTCVVVRGVNGTVAAAHVVTTPIYIYEVPQPIYEATLVLAMKAWKRKDSAFQDAVGSPETGLVVAYKDEDPYVRGVINDYFRYL